MSRILTIDLETAPLTVHTWGIWQQNVGINQIIDPGGVLCFAAKFTDSPTVHFHSQWEDGEARMTRAAHKLLSEADAVMGWNSDKFDLRWLNSQFIKHGLGPPQPFAKVDLMKSARRAFYLPSYKLDYVAQFLGVGRKLRTGGFDLWSDVLAGEDKARRLMQRYNTQDTRLTEQVFHKLHEHGWVRGLPNFAIEGGHVCPHCESERLQRRGYQHSKTRRYARWQCRDCGGWSQSTASEPGGAKIKAVA